MPQRHLFITLVIEQNSKKKQKKPPGQKFGKKIFDDKQMRIPIHHTPASCRSSAFRWCLLLFSLLLVCLLLQVEQTHAGKKGKTAPAATKTRGNAGSGAGRGGFMKLFTNGGRSGGDKSPKPNTNVQKAQNAAAKKQQKRDQKQRDKQKAQEMAKLREQKVQRGNGGGGEIPQPPPTKPQKPNKMPQQKQAAMAAQQELDPQKLLAEESKVEADAERVLFSPSVQQAEKKNSRFQQLSGVVKVLKSVKSKMSAKKGGDKAAAGNVCQGKVCQQQMQSAENTIQQNIDFVLKNANGGRNNNGRKRRRRRRRNAAEQEQQCTKMTRQMSKRLVGTWIKKITDAIKRKLHIGGSKKDQADLKLIEDFNKNGCLNANFEQLEEGMNEQNMPPPQAPQPNMMGANSMMPPRQQQQMSPNRQQRPPPPSGANNNYYPSPRRSPPPSPNRGRQSPPNGRVKRSKSAFKQQRRGEYAPFHRYDDHSEETNSSHEEHHEQHSHASTETDSSQSDDEEEEEEDHDHYHRNKKMRKGGSGFGSRSLSAEDGGAAGGDMEVENDRYFDQYSKKKVKPNGTRTYERHTTSRNKQKLYDSGSSEMGGGHGMRHLFEHGPSGEMEAENDTFFDEYSKEKIKRDGTRVIERHTTSRNKNYVHADSDEVMDGHAVRNLYGYGGGHGVAGKVKVEKKVRFDDEDGIVYQTKKEALGKDRRYGGVSYDEVMDGHAMRNMFEYGGGPGVVAGHDKVKVEKKVRFDDDNGIVYQTKKEALVKDRAAYDMLGAAAIPYMGGSGKLSKYGPGGYGRRKSHYYYGKKPHVGVRYGGGYDGIGNYYDTDYYADEHYHDGGRLLYDDGYDARYGGGHHGDEVYVLGPSVHAVGANGIMYGGAGAYGYGAATAHQQVRIQTHVHKRRRGKWAVVGNVVLVIGIIIVVLFLLCILL